MLSRSTEASAGLVREGSPPDAPCVIEVSRDLGDCSFEQLVTSAYLTSRNEPVVLILRGVSPAEVDAVLDPLVALYPRDIPGVRYTRPLTDPEAEAGLKLAIGDRFPYSDPSAASALIQRGWDVSLNGSFLVLHELCARPSTLSISRARLHELVTEWDCRGHHPLKNALACCACALIDKQPLPWREGVEIMSRIGAYRGQREALRIARLASNASSAAGAAGLSHADAAVRHEWDRQTCGSAADHRRASIPHSDRLAVPSLPVS